ncbi:MAG: Cys-tRNA(Pro) deacylase [Clostridium sp.]|nr:Cys-tRNA(Pro) deacylase [Clostridium sp.]
MTKTNALRMLDKAKIPYETIEYEVDEAHICGEDVALKTGLPLEQVFKTIVLHGERNGYVVFCLPVNKELNLKKAAAAIHDKKVELIAVKDLLKITGYIRGGCSPVGMKKKFPTYFDYTAQQFDKISVSAGVRGCQMIVPAKELIRYVDAKLVDVTE